MVSGDSIKYLLHLQTTQLLGGEKDFPGVSYDIPQGAQWTCPLSNIYFLATRKPISQQNILYITSISLFNDISNSWVI